MDTVQLVLVTLIVGLVAFLLISYLQTADFSRRVEGSSKLKKPTFLILGLNNSGKTALFYQLKEDAPQNGFEFVNTVSSIEPNISEVNIPFSKSSVSKAYQLIDYPGHLKYSQLLTKLILKDVTLQNIKGILYVIDSSSNSINQQNQVKQISRFLFSLFSQTEKLMNGVDFLFAINKQDLFDSIPVFKIKQLIEEEITKLVKDELSGVNSHSSGIDKDEDYEEAENEDKMANYDNLREFWLPIIGNVNNSFKFEMLEGDVTFIGGSVLKNNMEPWKNWFDEKVVN
ncbi:uncharacterized protein PRCAT00002019001 [Priceomyces carsonii]|uniref:uncharacterized protein n=1 Tax=Priceomyces carsonii TaxID=28549 RepID=UPI002ED88E88|nr:unnamed protein product [Priceomyces carsonii]